MVLLAIVVTLVMLAASKNGSESAIDRNNFSDRYINCFRRRLDQYVDKVCGVYQYHSIANESFFPPATVYKECCVKNCTTEYIISVYCPDGPQNYPQVKAVESQQMSNETDDPEVKKIRVEKVDECFKVKLNITVLQLCRMSYFTEVSYMSSSTLSTIYKYCCEMNCTKPYLREVACTSIVPQKENITNIVSTDFQDHWFISGGPSITDCPQGLESKSVTLSHEILMDIKTCFVSSTKWYKTVIKRRIFV